MLHAGIKLFLCTLLVVYALVTKDIDEVKLAVFCSVVVCACICMLLADILYELYQSFLLTWRPYQYFLGHHKLSAGNLVRLLKMSLQQSPKVLKKVLVDSDDLNDLGNLFNYVACETDALVVVYSAEILSRPWCIGEVTSAKVSRKKLVKVELADFGWSSCSSF